MSRPLKGERGCPLASPLAWSHTARNARAGAAIRRVAPMTLSVPPFHSFAPSLASPGLPGLLLALTYSDDGGGGS
jgi:hypothetical protein